MAKASSASEKNKPSKGSNATLERVIAKEVTRSFFSSLYYPSVDIASSAAENVMGYEKNYNIYNLTAVKSHIQFSNIIY